MSPGPDPETQGKRDPADTVHVDVRVTWWRRYGQNRLLVEEDGRRLGSLDLLDGNIEVDSPGREDEVRAALTDYLATRPGVPRPPQPVLP